MLTNSEKSRFFLADLTGEVQSIPNTYGYISNLGLFRSAPITQTTFLMDLTDWDVSLLDAVDRDSRKAETSAPERVRQISFPMMYFKEVESITPDEIQGVRQPGTANELTTEAVVRAKKLMKIRTKFDITREFLFMQALKGKVVDARGTLYADLYKQFDVEKKTIYFDLDNPNADIDASIEELRMHMEDEAKTGTVINGEEIHVVVDRVFFSKLTKHPKIRDAYLAQQTPLAWQQITGSLRTGGTDGVQAHMNTFYYGGVKFVQYNGKFKDKRGKVHTLVSIDGVTQDGTVGVGHAFPNVSMLGEANNIFEVAYGPCPKMGYANTLGQELYVFEYEKDRDEGIDFEAHSYMLPYCTRPQLLVDVRSDAQE